MTSKSPFERATPESQGVASSAISEFVDRVESERLGLHSFMLLRHGRVVAEAWWQPFASNLPHVLYSLTKSFTSTAAGLAISEGKLNLDDPVLSFFPRDVPRKPSENWRAMRVRHLLSMTTGHEADPGMTLSQYPPGEWMRCLFETAVPYEPGTHFVYNSTGSHLISTIVQKVTGQKLINYLGERLFRPLGISRPYWETDPKGVNWGGWGLYLRTDEIARFGQTLLQRGAWQGRQLIPAEWLEQATRKQVPNGDDPNSDWAQGYGYQFWMSRHGYRGDGAFGQFCVVLPEHDAVLVTTASSRDMQAILNVAWETLLPGFHLASLPDQVRDLSLLRERLACLEIEGPTGSSSSRVERELAGCTFRLDSNALGWQSIRLQPEHGKIILTLATAEAEHPVAFGLRDWEMGQAQLDTPVVIPVAATARWSDPRTLEAAVCYLPPAATRRLKLRFDADTVEIRTVLAGSFAPPEEVLLTGRVA